MAKVITTESNLSSIANAIRQKNGLAVNYKPSEMAAAILALDMSGYPEPTGTVTITQNGVVSVKDKEFADVNVTIPSASGVEF